MIMFQCGPLMTQNLSKGIKIASVASRTCLYDVTWTLVGCAPVVVASFSCHAFGSCVEVCLVCEMQPPQFLLHYRALLLRCFVVLQGIAGSFACWAQHTVAAG